MFRLFVSLALLGLSAVDPIGIAAMPVLLVQKQPYKRSFIFLGGSLISLMAMGLLFALGFGTVVLRIENAHRLLVPTIELLAGLILFGIASILLWRLKTSRGSVELSSDLTKKLQLRKWQLFFVGATLVAVQSMLDVVFLIAMIRIGQLHVAIITLIAAVATYAFTALLLQICVVLVYRLSPSVQKAKALEKVHNLLARYANQALIIISFILGCVLLFMALYHR